jgi:hypothetical protein
MLIPGLDVAVFSDVDVIVVSDVAVGCFGAPIVHRRF